VRDRELISTPDVSQKKRPVVAIVGGSFGVLPPSPFAPLQPHVQHPLHQIDQTQKAHKSTLRQWRDSGAPSTSPELGATPLHTHAGVPQGLACARELSKDCDVILIDKKRYFEYTPGVLRLFTKPSLAPTLRAPLDTFQVDLTPPVSRAMQQHDDDDGGGVDDGDGDGVGGSDGVPDIAEQSVRFMDRNP
jgi:hypothetical protein